MAHIVVEIFSYDFMRNAVMAGTIAAILAGIVGYFVVIRHLAFAGHALGHIGFAGATGAILIGTTPIIGQLCLTVFAACGMGMFGERINKSDIAIGVMLAFSLGLGTLFLHFYTAYAGQATAILFGDLLGVSQQAIKLIMILTVLTLIALSIIARPLLFTSLEPELAEAKGISLPLMAIFNLIIIAVAVTIASQVVGVLLVFTLLIGPAAIAQQWTRYFWPGLIMSTVIAVITVWLGIILAWLTDWPISFWISAIIFVAYILSQIKTRWA
jgi:zinc/manganese transport system permease protein